MTHGVPHLLAALGLAADHGQNAGMESLRMGPGQADAGRHGRAMAGDSGRVGQAHENAIWPGRFAGARRPMMDETALSHAEIEFADRRGLFVKDQHGA